MIRPALFAFCVLVGCSLLSAADREENFLTLDGRSYRGTFSALYGDVMFLNTKKGSCQLPLTALDDASLRVVAAHLALPATPPPLWRDTSSKLGKGLTKKLEVLSDGKLVNFVPGDRPEPEFYLIYFGAYWCGPCRRFSPQLVSAYNELKRINPDRFEVIFVSDDEDRKGQLAYAREVKMPFPILHFGTSIPEFDRWQGRGIPCLVVLNRKGDLIFHSYSGEKYLGADDPLEKFSSLHAQLAEPEQPRSKERHRLAVASYLNAAGTGDHSAELYLLSIDIKRNRTLPKGVVLNATLKIGRDGHVTDAKFSPKLEFVVDQQLQHETENWLFLPAVRQGQSVETTLELKVKTPD